MVCSIAALVGVVGKCAHHFHHAQLPAQQESEEKYANSGSLFGSKALMNGEVFCSFSNC